MPYFEYDEEGIPIHKEENLKWRIGASYEQTYHSAPGYFWFDKNGTPRGPYRTEINARNEAHKYYENKPKREQKEKTND